MAGRHSLRKTRRTSVPLHPRTRAALRKSRGRARRVGLLTVTVGALAATAAFGLEVAPEHPAVTVWAEPVPPAPDQPAVVEPLAPESSVTRRADLPVTLPRPVSTPRAVLDYVVESRSLPEVERVTEPADDGHERRTRGSKPTRESAEDQDDRGRGRWEREDRDRRKGRESDDRDRPRWHGRGDRDGDGREGRGDDGPGRDRDRGGREVDGGDDGRRDRGHDGDRDGADQDRGKGSGRGRDEDQP